MRTAGNAERSSSAGCRRGTAGSGRPVRVLRPRIHQLAFRYLKNWEDAEEVTQDVLLKVYRKIDAFRGDAALSSWIYRITFNTAMSRLRSGPVQPRRRAGSGPDPPSAGACTSQRAGGLVVARRRPGDAARDARAADPRADDAAGGLSHAGDPARHPGVVDRRGERRASGEAADAQVAAAPRPADPSRAPVDFAGVALTRAGKCRTEPITRRSSPASPPDASRRPAGSRRCSALDR